MKPWPLCTEGPSQAGETGKWPAVFFALLEVAQGMLPQGMGARGTEEDAGGEERWPEGSRAGKAGADHAMQGQRGRRAGGI